MSTPLCAALIVAALTVGYWAGRARPLRVWRRSLWGKYVLDARWNDTTRAHRVRAVVFPLAASRRWWSTRLAHRLEWWRVEYAAHRCAKYRATARGVTTAGQ